MPLEGVNGRECEIPMDTRGQSADTGGQKRIIWILLYYGVHGRNRSHCRDWELEYHVNMAFEWCAKRVPWTDLMFVGGSVIPERSQESMMGAIESENQRLGEVLPRPVSCHFALVRGYGRGVRWKWYGVKGRRGPFPNLVVRLGNKRVLGCLAKLERRK